MRPYLFAAALASLALPALAQAPQTPQPPPRDYHILGSGTINCATWTAESKQGIVKAQNQAWLLGYLTAFNRFGTDNTGDVLGPTSIKDALAWFDDYCGKNARDSVNKAAGALILELEGRKPPPPEPPPPPSEQGIVHDVPPAPAAEPAPEPAKPAAKAPARRPAKKK